MVTGFRHPLVEFQDLGAQEGDEAIGIRFPRNVKVLGSELWISLVKSIGKA